MCASVRCWGAPEAARSTSVDVGHVAECLVMSRCLSPYRSREPRLRFGGKLLLLPPATWRSVTDKNNLRGYRLVATVARALCTPTHQVRLPAFYLPYSMINHLHDMARMRIAPATRITMFPGHFMHAAGQPFLATARVAISVCREADIRHIFLIFAIRGCGGWQRHVFFCCSRMSQLWHAVAKPSCQYPQAHKHICQSPGADKSPANLGL